MLFTFFFFFSSRRRHTRCSRDWSSDVCSSDLRDVAVTGVQTCALPIRSEEHTSELQSRLHLVCRLLLEKKKKRIRRVQPDTIDSCGRRTDAARWPSLL